MYALDSHPNNISTAIPGDGRRTQKPSEATCDPENAAMNLWI